jgi:DNA repair protein RadC
MRMYHTPLYTVSLVRDGSIKTESRPQIRSATDAYALLKDWFLDKDRESFVIIMLNAKNKVIGINEVSIGSLTSSIVHPREVFKPAILSNAVGIILSHNHPSGDPTPSPEDKQITRKLRAAGELLSIKVLDHVIVGEERFVSFVDDGYWD